MKKILYLVILSLAIILPMNVDAAYVEKLKCDYVDDDLDVTFKVRLNDSNNKLSVDITVRKFGDDTEGLFFLHTEMQNYFEKVTKNKVTLDAFQSSTSGKYKCPKWILVTDGGRWQRGGFYAYVSDSESKLDEFAKALKNNPIYYKAKEYEPETNKYQDIECPYHWNDDSLTPLEKDISSATVKVKNDDISIAYGKIRPSVYLNDEKKNSTKQLKIAHFNGTCPSEIYYVPHTYKEDSSTYIYYDFYSTSPTNPDGNVYKLLYGKLDPSGGSSGIEGGTYDPEYDDDSEDVGPGVGIDIKEGCGIFSNDLKSWLIQLLDLIKVGGLVLTLILGMLDFFKGVASGEADAMKKIWKSFSRRLISVIILFLLPLLIEFLFGLINISGINSSNPLCGIK